MATSFHYSRVHTRTTAITTKAIEAEAVYGTALFSITHPSGNSFKLRVADWVDTEQSVIYLVVSLYRLVTYNGNLGVCTVTPVGSTPLATISDSEHVGNDTYTSAKSVYLLSTEREYNLSLSNDANHLVVISAFYTGFTFSSS